MAMRYMKLSNCGTAASQGRDADDIEIAAAVLIIGTKRRWGGSIPGHKTYKRDREGANKILNAQYFVEHPIDNPDHFRRSLPVQIVGAQEGPSRILTDRAIDQEHNKK
ncbi:hypothetical protein EJB05_37989, partial [Eragrostis curvula]